MATMTRRGTYSEFNINKNDTGLRNALQRLQPKGEKALDGLMHNKIMQKTNEIKEELRRKAGSLASVRVPAWGGFSKSTNIHVKVANALKVHKNKTLDYKVHTGKTVQEAEVGVLGQRGGKLAHIVAKGMDSFRYGNLPYLVFSSTRWYKKTGRNNWISTGMRLKRNHPGFKDTFDYIGEIQKRAVQAIESETSTVIQMAAIASGFSATKARADFGGQGSNIRTNTGGTGK